MVREGTAQVEDPDLMARMFAAILAVLVLGESFRPYHALALALVLGGIFWAEWSKRGERVSGGP